MSVFNRKVTIQFDIATAARTTFLVVGLLMFINLIGDLLPTLTLIFTAFFLSIALNPAVRRIAHMLPSKSRKIATGVAFVLVVTFLGAFFTLTIPPIVDQVRQFAQDLPQTVEDFKSQDNFAANLINNYNLDAEITETAKDIATRASGSDGGVLGTVNKVTSTIINTIAVLIMTVMMLIEGPMWIKRFWRLTDPKKLAHRQRLVQQMYEVVTGYVNGQLLITTIAASFALIAMIILRVPNALAMAGIVAIFGLIPLIGTTLAAAVVVLSTMLVSVKLALAMAVFFLVYQQIENATIQPYIQGRKSSLTALTVFIAALLGVNIAGLFGAFVAIPIAGCLKVLLDDYLQQSGRMAKPKSKAKKA